LDKILEKRNLSSKEKKKFKKKPELKVPVFARQNAAYWEIASAGHSATQAPQSMQVPSSTKALPSFIEIASTGHAPTQASQPTHFESSTFAAIIKSSWLNFSVQDEPLAEKQVR